MGMCCMAGTIPGPHRRPHGVGRQVVAENRTPVCGVPPLARCQEGGRLPIMLIAPTVPGGKPNPEGSVVPLCAERRRTENEGVPSVLIVDDHAGFRTRARRLLEAEGWHVVGEAADAAEALKAADELQPDVVLLDVHLPDGNGLSVARELCDGPAVILTSSHDAGDFADRLPASGARGFVPKGELSGAALSALLP